MSGARFIVSGVLLIAVPVAAAVAAAAPAEPGARTAARSGDFATAAALFAEQARVSLAAGRVEDAVHAQVGLSDAYANLGRHPEAVQAAERALDLAEGRGEADLARAARVGLGSALRRSGSLAAAREALEAALAAAEREGDQPGRARALFAIGSLEASEERHAQAGAAYRDCVSLAQQSELAARCSAGLAVAALGERDAEAVQRSLAHASEAARLLDASHDKADVLLRLATVAKDACAAFHAACSRTLPLAVDLANEAAAVATAIGDRRSASYAWGSLGKLYEDARRHEDALHFTRRAVFAAQQANAPESLYLWEWQTARLLRAGGDTPAALAAARRAARTLEPIRPLLAQRADDAGARESVVSFFLDLVDLLLQSAGAAPAAPQRTALLQEARETMELLKVAELQNYFRQDCVDPAPSEPVRLDDISPRAAVIYPILLPERTEVLVGTAAGMSRHVAAVGQARVTAVIRELRRTLQKRTTFQYLQPSRQLYDWLIRPLEPELAEGSIDTLVFVPYGALGTVPPSALHDGSNFLIEKYAVAITPGLRLTDPRAFRRDEVRPFLAGLTEPVQGFPPLANAGEELRRIHEIYGGEILIDEQFRVARVEKELENERFDVVHIASHGEFRSDADDTFLLTFDGKLTMNGLSDLVSLFRHREDRLELLALSACETAVGDDRAALGLAGVAVRAGAKSALATLWYVDDQASARLVTEFYRQLQDPALSKAAALQRAQLSLMSHRPYRHPAYWSPYLLINNWL